MTNLRPTSEQDRAIVNLVDRILVKAIEDRTSHLYFEPQPQSLQIRVRKNGYTLGDRVLRLAQVKVAVASSFM